VTFASGDAHDTLSSRVVTMLDSGKMIGFLGTSDFERARQFYEGKLGWKILSTDAFAMIVSVGGHVVRIVKIRDFRAVPYTVLGWEVEDVVAVVTWLKSRGVEVERYPWVPDKETGVWVTPNGDKVAWFQDPDGNVLSVSQHARPGS
jgi:catechol 2,3-dioxygenase-like lactoylglutathione lyase family enzyme